MPLARVPYNIVVMQQRYAVYKCIPYRDGSSMAKTIRKSITITARITPEVARLLNNYTRAFRHTKSSAVQSILEQFLDYDNWVVKEIEEGIASAEKGPLIPQEEVFRKLREMSKARRAKQRKRRRKG